ncbi:hypothetical protein KVV02_008621 [Mortierella alpina]|uniref:RNA helicase n=1 Tax=Mortierella alpina TaxID=64518 RepID=A0A9P8AC28_MORAP|nr:hypothetical protein KVV02_008621 [Mortierella alpina]
MESRHQPHPQHLFQMHQPFHPNQLPLARRLSPQQQQQQQHSASIAALATAHITNHTMHEGPAHLESLRSSSSTNQWSFQNTFSPQPDQTPLSIPHNHFFGQPDPALSPFGLGSQQDSTFGSYMPSPMPYGPGPQQQQRIGRPLSSHMSFAGTPVVAPQPTRQRVPQHSVPHTPMFPYKQQPMNQFQPQNQHQHQHQQQFQHQLQHQHQHQHQSQQQPYPQQQPPVPPPMTPVDGDQYNYVPMGRSDSEGGQASVLKMPPGYFPIYNGSEWIMISQAAAAMAGIPVPNPQSSPSYGLNGTLNANHRSASAPQHRLDDGASSQTASPPANIPLSRQGSEPGRMASGTDLSRTESGSRRGSVPPPALSSRASSPADYKATSKSPSYGSPRYRGGQHESSNTVQDNLDFLELLQKYDYLNAWSRHGKSKTSSEVGSPVDGTSTPRKQEPFEKSLALKDITEWIEEHRDYLLREQPDLLVPGQIDFGNVNPKTEPINKTIRIENHGTKIVQLQALRIIPNAYEQLTCLSQDVLYAHPANGTEPMFGNIEISLVTGANLGFFSSWLLVLVNESSLIGRKITWNVTNNTQLDREMDPYAKAYVPPFLRNLNLVKPRMVITGEQVDTIDFQGYLKSVDHPCYKKHNGKFSLEPPVVEPLEIILPGQISIDLSADSYASRLLPLLQVEQHLSEEDVSSYNLFMVEIKLYDASANIFQIQVGGLSEKCPLLVRGDSIIIRQVTNEIFAGIEYRTFVHGTNMRSNSVYVHLPIGALPSLVHERWNVQFKANNNQIREMYRAVGGVQEFIGYHPRDPAQDQSGDQIYSARSFLFPTIHDARSKTKLPNLTLEFVDPSLNWEQKATVQSIVRNDYGLVPFIISGPPGTGKTKTLAETALQILMNDTQSHILITAPSHSACDTIMNRLIPFLKPQYIFRLNGPTRTFAEVPTAIMPYCFGSVYFNMPPLDDLLRFRIVVCTCADAGLLISAGASNQSLREYLAHKELTNDSDHTRSHWTHLLIDEAAQAIEPETDIPLLCILEETETAPQIVLCGDHQQLGPKTFLPELQLSFLERLITQEPLYRDHPQSRQFSRPKTGVASVAKKSKDTEYLDKTIPCFANLVQNYRCHPKMLMMPSVMFYNDTLVASAEDSKIMSMLGCPVLPNPECPIAFVGVHGLDASQIDEAVSWYNEAEAEKVVSIIETLCGMSKNEGDVFGVKISDIGVIAPFREQVKLLRQLLRSKGFAGVNVGTVEDYQGQEYRIMLISTTRSRQKYLDQDVRQGLGLVHFRKRFNVALTRAMAMMVIVGNPELLVLDEHWANYLHFCLRNGAYTGCALPDSILNTHTTGQKDTALIGRLEMNSFVSQFVENLDRRRWLGGNTEEEQEGFIVVPTGSESGDDEDEGLEEEEDEEEAPEEEGEEIVYEQSKEYDESLEGLSHALSHQLDLDAELGQNGTQRQAEKDLTRMQQRSLENSDRGDDEDEETRVAKERLAIGSLNMDDDTPEMRPMTMNYISRNNGGRVGGLQNEFGSFGHQHSQSSASSSQGASTASSSVFRNQRQAEYTPQHQHQHQHQQQQSQNLQHHGTPLSAVSWPSNDHEFKRMSSSKLVLERSFDPSEQDIFDDY